ncbi:hypothetical protein JCM10213v2_002669 [Rhodosporidiobolus nylandii]
MPLAPVEGSSPPSAAAIHAIAPARPSRLPHGGSVRAWQSYERAAPFALVCKAWRGPAQSLLFSSVALIGKRQATLFLRTANDPTSAALPKNTAALVLGVDRPAESSRDGTLGQVEASEALVSALAACPAAVHVHVRPLASSVRSTLHAAVFNPERRLRTFVLSPRVLNSLPWSGKLWSAEDVTVAQALTSLENLEIATFVLPVKRYLTPSFPTLALRRLKIHHDQEQEILSEVLRKSPRLEFVDFYFEQVMNVDAMAEALRVAAPSLREMRYIANPTHSELPSFSSSAAEASPPLFDTILPLATSLISLRISATDLSPSALLALPPALQKLHIRSLNVHAQFTCAALLEVLRRDDLRFPSSFRELTVVDSPEFWDADPEMHGDRGGEREGSALQEIRRRLKARAVRFTFKLDFEEDDETSGSSHHSPNGSARRSSASSASGSPGTGGVVNGDAGEA